MHWKLLFLGFIWGTVVSIGNYCYLSFVVKKNEKRSARDQILSVVRCYVVRYFINIAALLGSYLVVRDIWVIAGTGFGLTVMKNVTAVLELKKGRECQKAGEKRKHYRRLLGSSDDDF